MDSKKITTGKRLENKKLVLDELRKVYERKYSASDTLDGKLQNIFNFLSVVVSVVPTLELMIIPDLDKMSVIFVILLLVVLILYLVSFRKVVASIGPVYFRQPVSKNWDELKTRYFHSKEEKVIDLTISEYLLSSDEASINLDQKIRTIKYVSNLMAVIVVLLLVAVPVNMFVPQPTLTDAFEFVSHLLNGIP